METTGGGRKKKITRTRTIKSSSSRAPNTTTASFYTQGDKSKLMKQCEEMRDSLKPSENHNVWNTFLKKLRMDPKCISEKNDCNTYAVCPIDIYLKHMQQKKTKKKRATLLSRIATQKV